ncbi:DUF4377 domain-containing protein [Nocardia canadensis]|uniref:DUF4377 domain-containing protein n=1 Tax=Nocardia canadensis TaxID=3065238 RepID=UPI00292F9E0D|nr:DUF4377 domain-containing protein [Nocardia canadensis]
MRRLLPLGAMLAVGVLGCGSPAEEQPAARDETVRMFVAPEQVDCVGVAPMRCLQIRYSPDERWQLFSEGIAGFSYEPGYDYELTVRVTPVDDPPADHSSRRYDLVRVDAKTPV